MMSSSEQMDSTDTDDTRLWVSDSVRRRVTFADNARATHREIQCLNAIHYVLRLLVTDVIIRSASVRCLL